MDQQQQNLSGEPGPPLEDAASNDTLVSAALGLATALGGGYVCGLMIDQFGSFGGISLWVLGIITGFAATKLTQRRSNAKACILITACLLALVVAEVCWIRWNIRDAETWTAAIAKFPLFLNQFRLDAFIAAIFTFFGCQAVYRQTAVDRSSA